MPVLRQAAVIGLGERGQAWVARLVAEDWQICSFDPQVSVAIKGVVQRATISLSVEQAGLVIVAVPDRLALIRKVIQTVQGAAAPGCSVLVHSALPLADIRGCAARPQQVFCACGDQISTFPNGKIRV